MKTPGYHYLIVTNPWICFSDMIFIIRGNQILALSGECISIETANIEIRKEDISTNPSGWRYHSDNLKSKYLL